MYIYQDLIHNKIGTLNHWIGHQSIYVRMYAFHLEKLNLGLHTTSTS